MNHRQTTRNLNSARIALRIAYRKLTLAARDCDDPEFRTFARALASDTAGLHDTVVESMAAVKLFEALDRIAEDVEKAIEDEERQES